MFSRVVNLVVAFLIIEAVVYSGWAQESRGTILGRVTDSSGLLVPGVSVQVTNIATGVTLKGATNDEGNYFFSFLIPGMYRVTAEKQGFKRSVRDAIEVNVNARLELNLSLEIGAMADTITVTGEAPLLDTTNASVGRVIDSRETRELPLNHGNPFNLIRLSGGVNFTDQAIKDQPWQTLNTNYAMAGSRASKLEFTLDGASNTLEIRDQPTPRLRLLGQTDSLDERESVVLQPGGSAARRLQVQSFRRHAYRPSHSAQVIQREEPHIFRVRL